MSVRVHRGTDALRHSLPMLPVYWEIPHAATP
jgi:hypothetical protein